jgi:trans-2,3-dihydro-3-hydroxyanthranilate isomerase
MPKPDSFRYRVVDVFTTEPLEGNPLAVFPDASKIEGGLLQKIARELNLSETVFVLPATRSDSAVRLRIFTPAKEIKFAGHPTIGTAFVLRDEGIVPGGAERFVLEEGVGPVPVEVERADRPRIWLTTPPITFGRSYDPALCARLIGLESRDLLEVKPELVSAANPGIFIAVRDKAAVDRAKLDTGTLAGINATEPEPVLVFVFAPAAEGAYSRMFAPDHGVPEDPATGSATGPLAAFMIKHGLVSGADGARFISEQGVKIGRRSLLHVRIRGDKGSEGIDVGGYVTPLIDATMTLAR